MLTIIIENELQQEDAVKATMQSLEVFKDTSLEIHTVIITQTDIKTLSDAIQNSQDPYFCILTAGDTLAFKDKDSFLNILDSQKHSIIKMDYVPAEMMKCKVPARSYSPAPYNIESFPVMIPQWLYSYIFKKELFQDKVIHSKYEYLYDIYQYLHNHTTLYYAVNVVHYSFAIPDSKSTCPEILEKPWYLDFSKYILQPFIQQCRNDNSYSIPLYLQYTLLCLIWYRFSANMNLRYRHVIDEEYPDFQQTIFELLQYIDDDVLFNAAKRPTVSTKSLLTTLVRGYNSFPLPIHFIISMVQLKYGDDYTLNYFQPHIKGFNDIWVQSGDHLIQKVSSLKCNLDLMDYDKSTNTLILEYHIDNFVDLSKFNLIVSINGKKLPTEETYRYSHTKYFGVSAQKALTYRTLIHLERWTDTSATINWSLEYQGFHTILTINAKHYCARVSNRLKKSYWHFGNHVIILNNHCNGLTLQPASPLRLFKRELVLYAANVRGFHSIAYFGLRTLYWLTLPWMRRKTIWLTYDKLYKGGDCGEYFYKYCCTRKKETGITPAYVINKTAPDYKRLKAEKFKPLKYGSLKHLLYYLNSSVVFTTHGGVYNFNGLTTQSVACVQDLLHHDVACIQHGLTVQQLAHNSNRLFNNMKRYYCASKYEVQNLSHPIYGYEDKSMLKLTGIPRYDGLVNQDQRQILITPTWRNYIAMPAAAKNEAKPYFEGFKNTDYFKIYNELLSDEKLIATAKSSGYRLIYLLHPVISAQLEDYPQNDAVEIIPALTVDYEKILTESSLMVTDYSGVQFDFAYMRKPIIYYHPPKLPPHYKEGGFFYDTMGFGEICTEHNQIVETLCAYMENNCEVKPFYRKREDEFFAFDDLNSCQRIYDDMLEYQRSK